MSDDNVSALARLSDLIKTANLTSTYDELAERAIDPVTKTQLRRSVLSKIAQGDLKTMPPPGRIGAIAAALELDYEIVRRAAFLQYMPPRDDRLRDVEEKTLARMLNGGTGPTIALVERAYRLADVREDDERAEDAADEADAAVKEADADVPRIGPRRKSA